MDTLTIVVQLTGLLMFVPPDSGQAGPTRVLMPEPDHVRHTAVIGFRTPEGQPCPGGMIDGFCFVQMEGWILDPLPGVAEPVRLPRTIMNLTRNSGGREVHRDHLGNNPPRDSLRSRITFGGGGVSRTCEMGRWDFDPVGSAQKDTISLSNVVEWTIPNVAQQSVVLSRRRIGGGSSQLLATLLPVRDTVDLLVAHVPIGTWIKFSRNLYRHSQSTTPAAVHAPKSGSAGASLDIESSNVSHFRSYYKLLDRAQDRRIPSRPTVVVTGGCPMMVWFRNDIRYRAPTTVNCMVVSGSQ